MWTRVIGVVSVVLYFGAAGCGGDDDSSGGFKDSCTMGAKSVPGGDGDPCPQNDPKCPATMYMAVATCGADGKWTKGTDGAIACQCLSRGGGTGGASASMTPMAKCGNGVIEKAAGEQCEGTNLMGSTCMTLGMGMGLLKCDPTTCHYDMSMCGMMPGGGMGGNHGGMGGHGN